MEKVVIIGGGIVGQFIAYFLSKSDYEVTIIDDGPEMSPASAGNCGLITPSHIEPINSFSAIFQGLRWLGKKDAPLAIKPQLNANFIKWFLSFVWHSRKTSIKKAIEIRHELLQTSWGLYQDFFSSEVSKCEFKPDGLTFVAKSKEGFNNLKHEVELLKSKNLSCELLSREELLSLEPSLKDDILGGSIFRTDGWLKPDKLLEEIKTINSANGVTLVNGKVEDFVSVKDEIIGIRTNNEEISSNRYVLAAGALSYPLAKKIGITLPVIPGKGYNLTYDTMLAGQPKMPIYMFEKKVVATPWKNGLRLGSTMEFAGFDLSLNPSRLEALKNASKEYLTTKIDQAQATPWAGWRPMTSNGIPIIKQSEQYKNLVIATGHGMLGLSMAPVTGQIVAELLQERL